MQPRPSADTERPDFPSVRHFMPFRCPAAARVARRRMRGAWGSSFSRYRYPRLRAARYARVVRPVAWAVVPVARSHAIRCVAIRCVVWKERPEPEATSLKVAPLEAMVLPGSTAVTTLETMVHGPTAVTALETVTVTALCLARPACGEHERQCCECHPCDSFLHVAAPFLFPHYRMATAPGRFTPASP